MGFLSALIVGPCVAPPLMAALIVIGSSGDAVLGGAALFSLAMGMGLPLIVFRCFGWKAGAQGGRVDGRSQGGVWCGHAGAGHLDAGADFAGWLIMLLWGALAIGCGIYLGALERVEAGVFRLEAAVEVAGHCAAGAGILEIVGAAAGGDYWLRPLAASSPWQVSAS